MNKDLIVDILNTKNNNLDKATVIEDIIDDAIEEAVLKDRENIMEYIREL